MPLPVQLMSMMLLPDDANRAMRIEIGAVCSTAIAVSRCFVEGLNERHVMDVLISSTIQRARMPMKSVERGTCRLYGEMFAFGSQWE